jgi:signal transduction histidine kinase
MAHWGGREITLKRRLSLLKDLTLSNPRFGVDRTINSMIERLRHFYDADLGLLVMSDLRTREYVLYRSEGRASQTTAPPETIDTEFAHGLLALPPEVAVCYNRQQFRWWPFWRTYYAFDVVREERVSEGHKASSTLANTIDATSLISVPVFRQEQSIGRMYFGMQRWQLFDSSDVEFLLQVLEHVSPIIENIRLVDRLAADAAEEERQRIARDIHDSVIQPYIGFQIGLSGLRRKLPMGQIDLNAEIERLLEMTTVGIADLRSYVGGLKSSGEREISLLPAIQRFAKRFSGATGLGVEIDAPREIQLNDILVAEVFQMVAEGLSNIRRHTEASKAIIRVACDGTTLTLQIENDGNASASFKPFTPRSLSERAASLNGYARVDKRSDGGTIVHIEVPL